MSFRLWVIVCSIAALSCVRVGCWGVGRRVRAGRPSLEGMDTDGGGVRELVLAGLCRWACSLPGG